MSWLAWFLRGVAKTNRSLVLVSRSLRRRGATAVRDGRKAITMIRATTIVVVAAIPEILHGADRLHAADLSVVVQAERALVSLAFNLLGESRGAGRVAAEISGSGGRWREIPSAGDSGWNVMPGPNKRIFAELSKDWLGMPSGELRFRVVWLPLTAVHNMVEISPGSFILGSPSSELTRSTDEGMVTEVMISQIFWLGRFEVTQDEWEKLMVHNPSRFKGNGALPVENVSWEEAMEFCFRLTKRERELGNLPERGWEYCLPTEAQWEYACRAGTREATAFGETLNSRQANFDGRYPYDETSQGPFLAKTASVGSYAPNPWGLHDMHGNVWEWCLDWYSDRYPGGRVMDPRGAESGMARVFRGGGWEGNGQSCRSARRMRETPAYRRDSLGFRVALVRVP